MTEALTAPPPLLQLDDYVTGLAWSPTGDRLAATSLAGDLAVIETDPAGGREAVHEVGVHPGGTLCLGWSRDGATLATGGQDGQLRLRHRDGRQRVCELGAWVNTLAWSPTDPGRLAAAAGPVTTLIDLEGEVLGRDTAPSTVTSLAWSADGRRVGAGAYGSLSWYGPDGGEPVKRFEWKGSILTLAVAPNGKWVASGNQDNSVHVWRLWTAEDMEMTGYAAKIQQLAWDPTSRWLCVGDLGEITCWDFSGRGPRGTRPRTLTGHTRRITGLAFSGKVLASASADGTIRLWRSLSTKPEAVIDLNDKAAPDVPAEIVALAWHPDGRWLAVGMADGRVELVSPDHAPPAR